MPSVTEHLERAVSHADRRLAALRQIDAAISRVRIALGLGLFMALTVVFTTDAPAPQMVAVGVSGTLLAAFVIAARRHGQVARASHRWRAWRQIRLDRRARLARDWNLLPPPLALRAPADHPFAGDLQVLGHRSLHHLLDSAGTDGGRQRLADWLLTTEPDADAVVQRSALVRELVGAGAFRDRVALEARVSGDKVGTEWLRAWVHTPDRSAALQRALWITLALLGLTYGLVALFAFGLLAPFFVFGFLAYATVYLALTRDLGESFDDATGLEQSLGTLGDLFAVAERRPPRGERLEALLAPFAAARPSAVLRRVRHVVTALAVKQNGLLWLALNAVFPWDVWFALRLARLHREVAEALPGWLEAWATLEAAASLAEFADLNALPFPTVEPSGPPAFRGAAMTHPLLPPGVAVPNSFAFEAVGTVAIVTGSNMSGKSTFLRTLGSNLVLAFSGGPVCAEALDAVPHRLHAVLNVADSVQDGISYFYAEVTRLRQLLDAVEADDPRPVFFLIDEILRGTNNRERFAGSRAFIEALAESGRAVGVLSTHDLDLATIAGDAFENHHFRDEVDGDRMTFDYRIHEGPSTTTNALRVMASAGLPVDSPSAPQRKIGHQG